MKPPFDKRGLSQQERDIARQGREDIKAFALMLLLGTLAHLLFGLLETAP